MTTMTRLPGLCLLMLACGLSGCLNTKPAIDNQRHFVLDGPYAESSEVRTENARYRVGLKPIVLPGYLHDNRLTVRKSQTELIYLEQDRWAGRPQKVLADFIGNKIEEDLADLDVIQSPWSRDSVDYTLTIKFIRCEVTIDGVAIARAEWGCIDPSNPDNNRFGYQTVKRQGPAPLDSTPESIKTLSDAVAELAAAITKTIQASIEGS